MRSRLVLIFYLLIINATLNGQSLLDQLNAENSKQPDTIFTQATFKSTRIINGQSVETSGKKELNVIISHRFGNINTGVHQFYGLDQSSIRIGLEYGLTNRIDIGIGRSRELELVDSYIKLKLLRQSTGAYEMPVSLTFYSSMNITAQLWTHPTLYYSFFDRFSYVHELLIARKISETLSMQLVPGLVHRNLTETVKDKNILPYVGFAGRYKILNRISISTEYYWVYPGRTRVKIYNPLSFGIDIETGGHVFQLHFSNSRGMNERIMIPENHNSWRNSDFGFGFNIIRNFNLKRN
jgi:hypothetical protein